MSEEAVFNVLIATLDRVIFEGTAKSLILPGERGVFEVLPYHKKLISRLAPGPMILDGNTFQIHSGVVKVGSNEVTVVIEETR